MRNVLFLFICLIFTPTIYSQNYLNFVQFGNPKACSSSSLYLQTILPSKTCSNVNCTSRPLYSYYSTCSTSLPTIILTNYVVVSNYSASDCSITNLISMTAVKTGYCSPSLVNNNSFIYSCVANKVRLSTYSDSNCKNQISSVDSPALSCLGGLQIYCSSAQTMTINLVFLALVLAFFA